jgi:hypothetical protein
LISRFTELVEVTETRLGLSEAKRANTILRADSGAGSLDNINWALARGYHYHGKRYGRPSRSLIASPPEWIVDPKRPERQIGVVPARLVATRGYSRSRSVVELIVRCPKRNGQWAYALIVSSLPAPLVLSLTQKLTAGLRVAKANQLARAYIYFYDQRGGGVENSIKENRQGLALGHRNKRHFEGRPSCNS